MGAAGEVRSAGRRRGKRFVLFERGTSLDRLCNGLLKNPTRPSSTISHLKFPFRTLVIIKYLSLSTEKNCTQTRILLIDMIWHPINSKNIFITFENIF
jgi:hypothetical protein